MENIQTIISINAKTKISIVRDNYRVEFTIVFYWNALTNDCFFLIFYLKDNAEPVSLWSSISLKSSLVYPYRLTKLSVRCEILSCDNLYSEFKEWNDWLIKLLNYLKILKS